MIIDPTSDPEGLLCVGAVVAPRQQVDTLKLAKER